MDIFQVLANIFMLLYIAQTHNIVNVIRHVHLPRRLVTNGYFDRMYATEIVIWSW